MTATEYPANFQAYRPVRSSSPLCLYPATVFVISQVQNLIQAGELEAAYFPEKGHMAAPQAMPRGR